MTYRKRNKNPYNTLRLRKTSLVEADIESIRRIIKERSEWDEKYNRHRRVSDGISDKYKSEINNVRNDKSNFGAGVLGFKTGTLTGEAKRKIDQLEALYTKDLRKAYITIWGETPTDNKRLTIPPSFVPPSAPLIRQYGEKRALEILNDELARAKEKEKEDTIKNQKEAVIAQQMSLAKKEQDKIRKQKLKDARIAERNQSDKKLNTVKARLAGHTGKSRLVANSVKKKLRQDHECPYCGEHLGEQPHADHIYPISKGGLSIEENMVHVCAKCNMKKKDMTLYAYIKKYSLDRDRIEETLIAMGKDI